MQPQDNQPNTNPGVSPTPETPPTPTPQAATAPATEMPAQNNPTSTPMAEPAVNPVPESTNTTVQPAALTQVPSETYPKTTKSKSKLFIILGVVLVALAGIGFGVWYLFTNILVPNKYGNIRLETFNTDARFSILAPNNEKYNNQDRYYRWDSFYEQFNPENGRVLMTISITDFSEVNGSPISTDTETKLIALKDKSFTDFAEKGVKSQLLFGIDENAKNIIFNKNTSSAPYWWTFVYDGESPLKGRTYFKEYFKNNTEYVLFVSIDSPSKLDIACKTIFDSFKLK